MLEVNRGHDSEIIINIEGTVEEFKELFLGKEKAKTDFRSHSKY